jgi:dTDP-4-dehydrorhamnose reductase
MRAVIIGTSGQLATDLRRQAPGGELELLEPEKLDASSKPTLYALLDRTRPQLVLNAAAYTAVDRAESDVERAFAINETAPKLLAEWCEANGAALLHVSTDYVFDGQKTEAYREDDATQPLGVYGKSKLAGEVAVQSTLRRHLILRTSWVFSAHGQNFVKTMLRLARERDELRVVADQRGRPTASADLARVLWLLGQRWARAEELAWGTYHFAGRGETTWHGFASAIVAAQRPFTGRAPRVVAIGSADYPTPARRPQNSVLDTSGFERTFGLVPNAWQDDLSAVVRQLSAAE